MAPDSGFGTLHDRSALSALRLAAAVGSRCIKHRHTRYLQLATRSRVYSTIVSLTRIKHIVPRARVALAS